MNEIYEAVVAQLKEKKGHEEVLELWRDIWRGYENDGTAGIGGVLEALLHYPGDQDDDSED